MEWESPRNVWLLASSRLFPWVLILGFPGASKKDQGHHFAARRTHFALAYVPVVVVGVERNLQTLDHCFLKEIPLHLAASVEAAASVAVVVELELLFAAVP